MLDGESNALRIDKGADASMIHPTPYALLRSRVRKLAVQLEDLSRSYRVTPSEEQLLDTIVTELREALA